MQCSQGPPCGCVCSVLSLQRVTTASLYTPASRIVREVGKNRGLVPPLSALRKRLESRGWSSEEAAALWAQLVAWVDLKLQRQKLRDIIDVHEGRAASWAKGYSQDELEKLSAENSKLPTGAKAPVRD